MTFKPGDKVLFRGAMGHGIVKSVSDGGTVTLKSAMNGRRCFDASELSFTGEELDRRMREILSHATRETSLSATSALVDLGFWSAAACFDLVASAIRAKESM